MGCVIAELFLEGKALFDLSKVDLLYPAPTQCLLALCLCLHRAHTWIWQLTNMDWMQLLSYRRGEYDPAGDLAKVEPPMQHLILHMLQLQPGKPQAGNSHALDVSMAYASPGIGIT